MAYRSFKDLPRRTVADKVLRDNAFNIAKNSRYDGYQKDLASMFCMFFNKKTAVDAVTNEIIQKKKLADTLHKQKLLENLKNEKCSHLYR